MKPIELSPVRETTEEFERMEKRIKEAFKKIVYYPILRELNIDKKIINAREDLYKALESGRITFSRGAFRGRFDATTSKELRRLGAKWDSRTSTFKLPIEDHPPNLRESVSVGTQRFKERVARIDKQLTQNLPAKIAESTKTADLFSSTLSKTDRKLRRSMEKITVMPKLSETEQARIAEEWQENMDLWINNFAEDEIKKLRESVKESILSGNRYESLVDSIQKSYGVTANKAKFLARQETGLLMAKFKEARYTSSGIQEYKWRCVAGSKNHPVRPSHKILDGKIFAWNNPPITTAPDEPARRNNPGQDFNCRCVAVPIVRFNKEG